MEDGKEGGHRIEKGYRQVELNLKKNTERVCVAFKLKYS